MKDANVGSVRAYFTYGKHLAKAIRHLEKLISHFNSKYKLPLDRIAIKCIEIKDPSTLKNIELTDLSRAGIGESLAPSRVFKIA